MLPPVQGLVQKRGSACRPDACLSHDAPWASPSLLAGATPLMLPEPTHQLHQQVAAVQSQRPAAGEEEEEDGDSNPHFLTHANSYLPLRGVLQRSDFLLPLDRGSLDFYRSLMQGQER